MASATGDSRAARQPPQPALRPAAADAGPRPPHPTNPRALPAGTGAPMGVISYIRQIYLDADHYKLVKEAYAKSPRGMQRPEYDRALEGVIDSPRILLPANRMVEIDRMLRLAAELKQPAILYGVRE